MSGDVAADAAGTPRAGDVIGGKYRVDRVLGEGGMGVGPLGHHQALDEEVAIKFLRPEAAAIPEAVARFLREARTAAALKSEHVVRVIDVGTHQTGAPYMVMERLVGSDLGDAIDKGGPLPVGEAVEYVA